MYKKKTEELQKISSKRFKIINQKLNNRNELTAITLFDKVGPGKKTIPINPSFMKDETGKPLNNKNVMIKLQDLAHDYKASPFYILQ